MSNSPVARVVRHLLWPRWLTNRAFPAAMRARIGRAVAAAEQGHSGEIRFVVEGALDPLPLVRGETARGRALDVFSRLGVWDTQANNGVLVYLLLADRDVEILADRGFNDKVSGQEWEAVCREMEAHFARGEFEAGALAGIARVAGLVRRHFPVAGPDPDELPNPPALL
jgi:uncharacterized membrane protein